MLLFFFLVNKKFSKKTKKIKKKIEKIKNNKK